jgi:hypothetical protein
MISRGNRPKAGHNLPGPSGVRVDDGYLRMLLGEGARDLLPQTTGAGDDDPGARQAEAGRGGGGLTSRCGAFRHEWILSVFI